jgi:hypothetical protein
MCVHYLNENWILSVNELIKICISAPSLSYELLYDTCQYENKWKQIVENLAPISSEKIFLTFALKFFI